VGGKGLIVKRFNFMNNRHTIEIKVQISFKVYQMIC
jgi:hypothetical protein